MLSRLYFECHITISKDDLQTDEQIQLLHNLAEKHKGWKVASFLIVKGTKHKPEGFITLRCRDEDETKAKVWMMWEELKYAGLRPIRWKIEDTLYDSNQGDDISVIKPRAISTPPIQLA
jgi:hypothetical protein